MTKFLIGVALIALTATVPATAQILGGGVVGGLGGGIGGTMGGVTGSVGGSVGSTMNTTRSAMSAADRAREATRQAERATRRADRQAARQATRDRGAGLAGSTMADGTLAGRNGSLASGAVVDGMVSPRNRSIGGAASGNGMVSGRNRSLAALGSGNAALDTSAMRTRGMAAASNRGLAQVSATASGVPVYVAAATPAPSVVVAANSAPYPVYRQGAYYYGGPDVVYVNSYAAGGYMDRQYGDLRRDLEGTGATVRRRGDAVVIDLPADVTFAFNRSDIQPRFYGSLNAVARTLYNYPATDVEVIGHTDSVGSESYNLALSERRGRVVADYLVDRDAEPSRLVVEAMGETAPVATNLTMQGRAANRRVEIVLHPRAA